MGYPVYQRTNGTGTTTAIILDWTQPVFNVSFAVELQSGTATFGVQFTLDNVNQAIDLPGANTTVTWFNDVNTGTVATASIAGNYMFPVQALRLNVASIGPASQLQFVVLQGLPP